MKNTELTKRIVCSVLIVIFAFILVYTGIIMFNKIAATEYKDCPEIDRDMFAALSNVLKTSDDAMDIKRFDRPVLLVHQDSIRGNAYLFNMAITEHKGGLFNANMGIYAQEILLPGEELTSAYRMSVFTPGLASIIMPGNNNAVKTIKLAGQDVTVIFYDDASLKNGSFAAKFLQNAVTVIPTIQETTPELNDTATDTETGSENTVEGENPVTGTEGENTEAPDGQNPDEPVSNDAP